ncbi:MAG TPA: class II fructose-bisphosphate aldolase [Chthoniobacterales bacterium]|nr:class II fructose-bisphosphate aldolase [Chthoniobacterales bacterium]
MTKPRLFFDYALRNQFAFPSFNVCNLEIARGVIAAAEAENAPVMLQTYFGDLYHGGFNVLPQLLRILAEQSTVPVLVHQDHPDSDQMILRTLRSGYCSVMYDGGHLPLNENVKGAAYITEIAHAMGAAVEAELGQFGGENQGGRVEKASPEEAKILVEESGIDTLAVSVGSVHGQSSRLDLPLLEEIAQVTPAPLVLHGGSGIHPGDLREAIRMNVVKVNIGADIVRAWMKGLNEGALLENGDIPPHQVMMQHAATKVSEVARAKLSLMGASRHAKPLLQRLEEERADLPALSNAPPSFELELQR